jgi:hypothetical protein
LRNSQGRSEFDVLRTSPLTAPHLDFQRGSRVKYIHGLAVGEGR